MNNRYARIGTNDLFYCIAFFLWFSGRLGNCFQFFFDRVPMLQTFLEFAVVATFVGIWGNAVYQKNRRQERERLSI